MLGIFVFIMIFILAAGLSSALLGPSVGNAVIGWFCGAVAVVTVFHLRGDGSERQAYSSAGILWLLTGGPILCMLIFVLLTPDDQGKRLDTGSQILGVLLLGGAFFLYGGRLVLELWALFRLREIIQAVRRALGVD